LSIVCLSPVLILFYLSGFLLFLCPLWPISCTYIVLCIYTPWFMISDILIHILLSVLYVAASLSIAAHTLEIVLTYHIYVHLTSDCQLSTTWGLSASSPLDMGGGGGEGSMLLLGVKWPHEGTLHFETIPDIALVCISIYTLTCTVMITDLLYYIWTNIIEPA